MKISFIIPAYNEEKYIGQCLESILLEVKDIDHDYEIIVVNNASLDNTKKEAKKFGGVKVFDESRKGTNFARQKGLDSTLSLKYSLNLIWVVLFNKPFNKNGVI